MLNFMYANVKILFLGIWQYATAYYSINKMATVLLELRRPESIMLENLPKMLLGISPIMLGLFPINMLKYANSNYSCELCIYT